MPTFYKKVEVVNVMSIEIEAKHGFKPIATENFVKNAKLHARNRRAAAKRVKAVTSVADLPPERTIHFTCTDELLGENACYVITLPVSNFLPGHEAISVNVSYTISSNTTGELTVTSSFFASPWL